MQHKLSELRAYLRQGAWCPKDTKEALGFILMRVHSLNNAKRAKNMLRAKGIEVGKNICKFRVVSPDEIEYVCDAAKS